MEHGPKCFAFTFGELSCLYKTNQFVNQKTIIQLLFGDMIFFFVELRNLHRRSLFRTKTPLSGGNFIGGPSSNILANLYTLLRSVNAQIMTGY